MTLKNTQYAWLLKETAPKILLEMINIYGTLEVKGLGDNPLLLEWAKECGVANIYTHDSIPWCALAMTLCAKRAGLPHATGYDALRAKLFSTWGTPQKNAMLGDVLMLERDGGYHVTMYVGEDAKNFYCLGGNQSDSVNITPIEKGRIKAIRRSPGVFETRPVFLSSAGRVSNKGDFA